MSMAQEEIEIKIRTILDNSGLGAATKQLKALKSENLRVAEASQKIADVTGQSLKEVQAQLTTSIKKTKQFKFEWLGVMFLGMAMQQAFGGLLRASFATWSAVTEGTSRAGGAMTQLQAAWEFFKFSLFDALLQSGLFQIMVDWVLRLVEYWGNLTQKTQSFYAGLALVGLVIGIILFVVGQLALGLNSLSLLLVGHNLEWSGIVGWIKTAYAWITTKMIPGIVRMGTAVMTSPVFWMSLLVTAIILAAGYIVWLGNKLGGITEFLKALAAGAIRFAGQWAESWVDLIGGVIVWVMNKLSDLMSWLIKVAQGFDAIFGTRIASGLQSALAGVEELRNAIFKIKESDIFLNLSENLIDKFNLRPAMTGKEEELDFGSYLADITAKVTAAFTPKTNSGPMEVVVKNPDEIGDSVARRSPGQSITNVMNGNLFGDEMKRQGLPY
jgi:hypothetical protein